MVIILNANNRRFPMIVNEDDTVGDLKKKFWKQKFIEFHIVLILLSLFMEADIWKIMIKNYLFLKLEKEVI